MSIRMPSSQIFIAYLLFLFIGIPLIVFLTDQLHLPPGIAVAVGFLISIIIAIKFVFLTPSGRRRR